MPKIKDLGIKVIPETMKPPEVGGGAGCGFNTCIGTPAAARVCLPTVGCTDCTVQQFSICGTTPGAGCGVTCSDCTVQNFSICGTTPGACGVTCSDCTMQNFSICGTTPGGCTDCTVVPFSICGTTPCLPTLHGCGFFNHTFCGCTVKGITFIGCTAIASICGAVTLRCGASIDPTIVQQPGITREQISAMKDALRQQITALEEAEKSIGPKTAEEIDAREKQLNDELAQLKQRRKDLK